MKLIDRLLGRSEKRLKPLPRSADVRYLEGKVFVHSNWFDIYGRSGMGQQSVLFSESSKPSVLGAAIIEAIYDSQCGLDSKYSGESEEIAANNQRGMDIVGVSGWNELDRWYVIPAVELEPGKVTLSVMQRCKAGGSVSFKGFPSYKCPMDPEKIGEIVLKIINTEPMSDYVDPPSHT